MKNLQAMPPGSVLKSIIQNEFKGQNSIVSFFGAEAAIILHMVSGIEPKTPIIFLDTLKHFPETIDYRDDLCARFGLSELRVVTPIEEKISAEDPDGRLHKKNPDACCQLRKTIPMVQALQESSCWVTGRKQAHSDACAEIRLFEFQDKWTKINPL